MKKMCQMPAFAGSASSRLPAIAATVLRGCGRSYLIAALLILAGTYVQLWRSQGIAAMAAGLSDPLGWLAVLAILAPGPVVIWYANRIARVMGGPAAGRGGGR